MTGVGCGCCAGGRHDATTAGAWNAPGLGALQRRIARYPDALDRMIAGLSDEDRPALKQLTTRAPSDPSIAILDAWACLEDVLTFYDERIANEGYLRTATDRDALAGIAALVGYRPRPGVAASTFLAFEMDQGHDARLDAGIRVRSVPKPGEESQTFESIEDLEAREAWNKLFPQTRRPQLIPFEEALTVETLWFAGQQTALSIGDAILLYYDEKPGHQVLRTVAELENEQDDPVDGRPGPSRTRVQLNHVDQRLLGVFEHLLVGSDDADLAMMATHLALGAGVPELLWAIPKPTSGPDKFAEVRDALQKVLDEPEEASAPRRSRLTPTQLFRTLAARTTAPGSRLATSPSGPDERAARILSALNGIKPDHLFRAWRSTEADATPPPTAQLFAMRRVVGLFGHSAPPAISHGEPSPLQVAFDENPNVLFLETRVPELAPGSHLVIRSFDVTEGPNEGAVIRPLFRVHRSARNATTVTRAAYALSGPSTRVEVAPAWWSVKQSGTTQIRQYWMLVLQMTTVYCASQELDLADEPDQSPIGSCQADEGMRRRTGETDLGAVTIRLDRLVSGLEAGRTVVVTGTRAALDADGEVRSLGVPASEVATIAAATYETEPDHPDGPTRTVITLSAPLQWCYLRSSVKVLANVAAATHGESRAEILGNGDARVAGQTFRTQPGQLTFIASEDVTGVASTLEVRVDDVRWLEVDPGDESRPADHVFTTAPSGSDRTLVRFGDGVDSARPRTGQQNVRARYRVGIGAQANIDADSLTTLVTRPLGLKGVTNPVLATGGAGPDGADAIRERAPLGVTALGRLVGVQDYADFALGFAGVAKAVATALPINGRTTVHVTVAAPDNALIDPGSVLIRRLMRALRAYGDPLTPVVVEPAQRALLVLAARIRLRPGHRWSDVESRVRQAVVRRFAFTQRRIGQDALLSDVIATIGADDGVDYVDVDGWGYLDNEQLSSSLEGLAETLSTILAGGAGQDLEGRLVMPGAVYTRMGGVRPAGIGYLDPALPETFVLTEVPDAGR